MSRPGGPDVTEDDSDASVYRRWPALVDPQWAPAPDDPHAALHGIVGYWPVDARGHTHRFQANPWYVPTAADAPLTPVDVVLRRFAVGEDVAAVVLARALAETMLEVALGGDGVALLRRAPDGVRSVCVATAPRHRERVDASAWRGVTVVELSRALPAEGVDVLLNPGAAVSMRVTAGLIHRAATVDRESGE